MAMFGHCKNRFCLFSDRDIATFAPTLVARKSIKRDLVCQAK